MFFVPLHAGSPLSDAGPWGSMTDIENMSVEELFLMLESNSKSVVEEIQRLIHEKFSGNCSLYLGRNNLSECPGCG